MNYSPKIEARTLTITEIFRDFYVVPVFQREYVWESKNIRQLLEDIYYALYDGDEPVEGVEYFIGSIVAYEDHNKLFQIIDGQQRLTTIYIIFCCIKNKIVDLGDSSASLDNLIFGITQDLKTGEDINKHRLSIHYNLDSENFLKSLAKNKEINFRRNSKQPRSQTVENLHRAVLEIISFLEELISYGDPRSRVKNLKRFATVLANRVKIIRVETSGLNSALKVFETINDRGVGLNPIDLLKNYLFVHAGEESSYGDSWDLLKRKWDELLTNLYKVKEKPVSFLRYYLLSDYVVDLGNNLPEENIYDWLSDNPEKHKISESPIQFIKTLVDASDSYSLFLQCKNSDSSDNLSLYNIKKLQGRYRQHYILLIAGRELPVCLFEELTNHIENLLFVNTITRSTRRKDVNLVREFSQWANKLRYIKTEANFRDFIKCYVQAQYRSFASDFQSVFQTLHEGDFPQYRVRYIIAKIAQYMEYTTYSNMKPLSFYLDKSIHIEHILPKKPQDSVLREFDEISKYDQYVTCLGNLTLLEQAINSSVSNKSFELKKQTYRESQLLITRVLSDLPSVGEDTQIDRAVRNLKIQEFHVWSSTSIKARQDFLTQIAMQVWNLLD